MNSRLNTKCLRNFHFFVLFPFKVPQEYILSKEAYYYQSVDPWQTVVSLESKVVHHIKSLILVPKKQLHQHQLTRWP